MIIAGLWIGKLSKMEIYSMKSFIKQGHTYHLYTYEPLDNIPNGVIVKDANEIIPKDEIFTLKNYYLPFSDIFRYKLLYEKGNCWADLDMICLKPIQLDQKFIFSSERTIQKGAYRNRNYKEIANIGFLKAPPKSDFYKELYEKCMNYHKNKTNKDKIKYMRIMRTLLDKYDYGKYVLPSNYFCPIDWWNCKELFMNVEQYKSKYGCSGYTQTDVLQNCYCVHTWRSIARKKKLDFDADFHSNSLWEKLKLFIDN